MDTQPRSLLLPIAITVLITAVIFGIGGYYLGSGQLGTGSNTSDDVLTTPSPEVTNNTAAQKVAIKAAKEYQPPSGTLCTMALVPAIHTETGAKYTFSSGCLAPGWVSEKNSTIP